MRKSKNHKGLLALKKGKREDGIDSIARQMLPMHLTSARMAGGISYNLQDGWRRRLLEQLEFTGEPHESLHGQEAWAEHRS
jgi:hypothetical protein